MTLLLLIVVLFVTAGIIAGVIIVLLAWSILHPPRMTDGKAAWVLKRVSPGDLGMSFEDVSFDVRDSARRGAPLRLRAWWIPAKITASDRCVVMVHGYADAKVGVIAWARPWHSLGYHLLAIDLRAHGESGGTQCTGGYFERDDLRQVIDQLRAKYPDQTQGGVTLFGVSLGALTAAAAAANVGSNGEPPPELTALVLDSPIASFPDGIRQHIRMMGVAGPWLVAAALKLAERVSGADFEMLMLRELLERTAAPVLILAGDRDPFMPPAMIERLRQVMAGRANPHDFFHISAGVGHLMPLTADPAAYERRLHEFVKGSSSGENFLRDSESK